MTGDDPYGFVQTNQIAIEEGCRVSRERHGATIAEALAHFRTGLIGRRQFVRLLGTLGVGLTAAGVVGLGRDRRTGATSSGGHVRHHMFGLRQDGTPGAEEPAPVATPQLGQQPDGTTTWKVVVGGEVEEEVGVIELEAFFPRQITVNAGDSVFFDIRGFHNVHFYPGGGSPVPRFVPDPATGTPTAGAPRIVLNPEVAYPTPGMTVDGATEVNSGRPLGEPTPVLISFSAPGTYEYWCDVHAIAQMKGTVVVQEVGTVVPMDQAALDQMAADEMEALRSRAQVLVDERVAMAATPTPDGVPEVTVGLSAIGIEVNAFFPRDLTVAVGDAVRFTYTARDPEVPHTVSFASDEEAPEFILVEGGEVGPPTIVLNPAYVSPAGGSTYSGVGFVNSGLMTAAPDSPKSLELTFDTEGTFDYYCAIHGVPGEGMAGTITVR